MTPFDVVVVGSGAAGVSAAFPLAEAGLKVLIVDPDDGATSPVLSETDYLTVRREATDQWRWMFNAPDRLDEVQDASSPKFRVPTLDRIFRGYGSELNIAARGFDAIGSLAAGGLTAAWGAGVATFSDADLADFPITAADLSPHYRHLGQRMGLAGVAHDELSDHFGLDGLDGLPLPPDPLELYLDRRYARHKAPLRQQGFVMGAPRLAVLTEARAERAACAGLGLCLWGCPRKAIYSAAYDIARLERNANVHRASGVIIERIAREGDHWKVLGTQRRGREPFHTTTKAVVLAAGTIATTKIVLASLHRPARRLRLLSTPTAAFAMFFPALFGAGHEAGHGLAHHWYALRDGDEEVCGGLFPTRGLPVAEFVSRAPLTKGVALDLMRWILPATSVGNIFFHAKFSAHSIELGRDGTLNLEGGFAPALKDRLRFAARRLRQSFLRLGAITLPGSFVAGAPGSDAHYAGTLPMRAQPADLETDAHGELFGHRGVFIADASTLTSLPAKSHTFTTMANAARIGAHLAAHLST